MVDGKFEKIEGTDFELPCELVLLAMGFLGPRARGHARRARRRARRARQRRARRVVPDDVPGVFACGDMGRGQSLIVWAIAEGRSCAAGVDEFLMGDSLLPRPIDPTARPLL